LSPFLRKVFSSIPWFRGIQAVPEPSIRKIALLSLLGGAVPPALWVLYYRLVLDLELHLPGPAGWLFLPGVLVGSLLWHAGAPPVLIEAAGIIANGVAGTLFTFLVLLILFAYRWAHALDDAAQ
jgi:hypothetical protein